MPFQLRWCSSSHRSFLIFQHICLIFSQNCLYLITPEPHLDCLLLLSDDQPFNAVLNQSLGTGKGRRPAQSELNVSLPRCRVSPPPVPFMLRWCSSSHRSFFIFQHICLTFSQNCLYLLTPEPHSDCLLFLSDGQTFNMEKDYDAYGPFRCCHHTCSCFY